jgi:hypothetical protein
MDWISKITQFISDNEQGNIEVSQGISYSMREINDENYRMYHRKIDIEEEPSGFKRIFFPKMWVVYRSLVQNSDIDLKHLNIRIQDGVRVQVAPLLRMAYQSHLSRNGFGEFLDKVLAEMAWFGSVVVKRFDGGVDTVDWRNYITEPNNPDPQTRSHLHLVYKTKEQIDSYKWEAQEEIDELWETMIEKGEHLFKVLEFWTFNKEGKRVCVKALDNTITEPDDEHEKLEWVPYIIVDEFVSPLKKRRASLRERKALGEWETVFPFEQFDLFKCFGRTQGLGCGELLSGLQHIYNDLFNNKRKADKKALMGVTIHNALMGEEGLSELSQEFISNLSEGSMITLAPGESIQNLPFDTRAQDFQIMEDKIYELMRQIIGISAQGTGEELPTATSATQAQINESSAQTVYNYVRERLHHGIKKLFHDGYAQDILEEIDEKEFLAIVGDPAQLEAIDAFYTNNAMNSWALDVKNKTGRYPDQVEFEAVEQMLRGELRKLGDTRFPQFKKEIVKDLEYMFEFEITDESFNAIGRSQALMAIKADPMSTKSKARIEDELILMQGLNPRNFDKTPEEIEAEQQMQQQAMPPEAKKAPEQFAQPL